MELVESKKNKEYNEGRKLYISISKKNINRLLMIREYKKAFGLLILVLERLNESEKKEFIDYYSIRLIDINLGLFGTSS